MRGETLGLTCGTGLLFVRREIKEENHLVRVAITPFLQAESDYRYILREDEVKAWEKETMKDVKGYEVSKYQARAIIGLVQPLLCCSPHGSDWACRMRVFACSAGWQVRVPQ